LPNWSPTAWLPSVREADSFLGLITPYRMDIVQGNVVTREQAALLKPGMTRAQVRDVLGSPMLTDLFHTDRWDYAFTIRRQGTEPQRRNVVVFFKNDRFDRLEAPELPSEQEFVAAISKTPRRGPPPTLELTPEQRKALPGPPAASPAPLGDTAGPVRDYPPLEPS
jgi:outer membrane protein assembly factor BamE